MRMSDVIIIGGGQSGLVMSKSLTARGIDHIVLERGRIGEAWHAARWKSLHLLTTNALSALPDAPHAGDPEGFMRASNFAQYLQSYATMFSLPIIGGVEVRSVDRGPRGFRVLTNAGEFQSRAVVIATGACDTPYRPPCADMLSHSIQQIVPNDYREPSQLPPGGVLVVGASATGVQLAEEIHASGRPVTLSVGDHMRVPRRYRGRDIYDWMESTGMLDDPALENGNLDAVRRLPSPQLIGTAERRNIDLPLLQEKGVRLVGRLTEALGSRAYFAGDLAQTTAASHKRMTKVFDRIDDTIRRYGFLIPDADAEARTPFLLEGGEARIDFRPEGIRTIVWATGYRRSYPWLKVPALDKDGEIINRGGVTPIAGLFVLGLMFMRRRRSSFIDGCGRDAEELAPLIRTHLACASRQAA